MPKLRFLIPFVIFLTLFLVTGGFCYYLFSSKIQIQEEIKEIDKKIGQKESIVYARATNVSDVLKLLWPKIGFVQESYKVNLPQKPEKNATIKYDEELAEMKKWMMTEISHLKKVNNIKSQHFTDFGQYVGLEPDDQVSKIENLLSALQVEISDAVSACESFIEGATNIDETREAELDHVNSILQDIKSYANDLINSIQTKVNEYKTQISMATPTKLQIEKSRQAMWDAHDYGVELLNTLTSTTAEIDGKEKHILLPKISDSKAKNTVSVLLFLLHPNDIKFLKRVYKAGISTNVALPDDEYGVGNLEFDALIADMLININSPRYNTNPDYLTGIDLEKIIDSQSLTIRSLVELNEMLFTKLSRLYNTNHPKVPIDKMALRKEDINDEKDVVISELNSSKNKFAGATSKTNNSERENTKIKVEMEEDIIPAIESAYVEMLRPLIQAIKAHKDRHEKLMETMISLKEQMKIQYESPGKIDLQGGEDGKITFTDNLNHHYNIDLGKNDNIKPGMRFLVYNDSRGEYTVKGMIEVLRLTQAHYANCGLVYKNEGMDIIEGDKISNPLYRNRRFLKVAIIGKLEPPESSVTNKELEGYLFELGVPIKDKPDIGTELVILSKSINKLKVRTKKEKEYIEEFRVLNRPNEILVNELLIYFQDQ